MKAALNIKRDTRTKKTEPGGYEWWYFDAVSHDGKHRFAVTFFDGNPYSTRYNKRLKNGARPEDFPAVNIAIYENNEPIFYCFTEYKPGESHFSRTSPDLAIGSHKMKTDINSDTVTYTLNLKEKLPNGDAIVANLEFSGNLSSDDLLSGSRKNYDKHNWSVIQPRASVSGNIRIYSRNEKTNSIAFEGTGYHDHISGLEPMKNSFREWYRGRYHFEYGTLIYYILSGEAASEERAWIISSDGKRLLHSFDEVTLQDKSLSLFGLYSARKFILHSVKAQVNIQQSKILDNGPFYQRYSSDAFLHVPENDAVEVGDGISEYIRPDRIHWRLFWPLINMRIRYRSRSPHWIQYSKKLYRWTW